MTNIAPSLPKSWSLAATAFGLGVWGIGVICTFAVLFAYHKSDGISQQVLESWPHASKLSSPGEVGRLLVFIHPECPCSRATLRNLDALEYVDGLQTTLVCLTPDSDKTISKGALTGCRSEIEQLARLPNVEVFQDIAGVETERFGVASSGECLYFDQNGNQLCHGGITISRGHEGKNLGLEMLLAAIGNQTEADNPYPVYGCSLSD